MLLLTRLHSVFPSNRTEEKTLTVFSSNPKLLAFVNSLVRMKALFSQDLTVKWVSLRVLLGSGCGCSESQPQISVSHMLGNVQILLSLNYHL